MTNVTLPRWATPIRAHAEETYALTGRGIERSILHILKGDDKELEDVRQRLDAGLACSNCLQAFPAPPSLLSLPLFRELEWGPEWMRDAALKRVALNRCPACGDEVSPEMRHYNDWGTNDYYGLPEDNAPDTQAKVG